MKNKIISWMIKKIKFYYPNFPKIKIEKIKYGLEALYLAITKFFFIFLFSYFLNQTNQLLIFILFFGILRFNAFGLHLKTSNQCLIFSLIIFLFFPYLSIILVFDSIKIVLIGFISIIIFLYYAPADTNKRPLIKKRKRNIHKYLSLITALLYISFSLILDNDFIISSMMLALILECLLILPVSYKVFKLPYRNYERKEVIND